MFLSKWVLIFSLLLGHFYAADFVLDQSHASVSFSVYHNLISKTKGSFKVVEGKLSLNDKGKLAALEGEVVVKSIDTGNEKRDAHLRNPDFFDVKNNSDIKFKMTKYKGDKKKGIVTGILEIRGIAKKVALNAVISDIIKHPFTGKDVLGVALTGTINRKDFNVGNNFLSKLISDEVNIEVDFEAIAE